MARVAPWMRRTALWSLGLLLLAPARRAAGEPSAPVAPNAPTAPTATPSTEHSAVLERAARVYDRAVTEFEHRAYGAAARSFLEADALVPSSDAVDNAIVAARRAGDQPLLRAAEERAALRAKADPTPAAPSKQALVDAGPPGPAPAPAATSDAARHEELTKTAAAASRSPPPHTDTSSPAVSDAPTWLRPVFYGGVATTATLVGLTIWSGIDTLDAKSHLPGTEHDNEAVRARAHRTDALLLASVLVGAATTYVGVRWLSSEKAPTSANLGATFDRHRALLLVRGAF